jgi:hypothetical protein
MKAYDLLLAPRAIRGGDVCFLNNTPGAMLRISLHYNGDDVKSLALFIAHYFGSMDYGQEDRLVSVSAHLVTISNPVSAVPFTNTVAVNIFTLHCNKLIIYTSQYILRNSSLFTHYIYSFSHSIFSFLHYTYAFSH